MSSAAIRTGAPAIANDVAHDPRLLPWRDELLARGQRACAVFPITLHGSAIGVLAVHAAEVGFFGDEEVRALKRLAANLSFALEAIDRESRLQYQAALLKAQGEATAEGFIVIDPQGRVVSWNARFAEMWNITPDVLASADREQVFQRLVTQVTDPAWFAARSVEVYAHPLTTVTDEVRLTDGRVFLRYTAPVIGPDGTHLGRIWTYRDVTDTKRAEQSLRESEERFRLLARATNDAVWDWDLTTDSLWWNEGFEILFGFRRDEVEPTSASRTTRVHPDDRDRVISSIHHAIASGEEHWSSEYRFRRKDGSYAYVLDRGYVIRNAAGQAVRMIGSMTDLTERRQLEEQLRQSQKMEAIGLLAGGIAHDFNNLLSVINGFAELLAQDLPATDPRSTYVSEIIRAGESAAALTRQLLIFSRRQVVAPQTINLNQIVGDLERMLRRIIGEDIELVTRLHPDLGLVRADPGQIEQVLLNLVTNARDAMPQGGTLTIETANVQLDANAARPFLYATEAHEVRAGRYVLLAVSDTGIGMSPEVQARIFEPFFTTKEPGKGTGLGLATVYGIVTQCGGYVGVYSHPGAGTTFNVYLPQAEAEQPSATAPDDAELVLSGHETILLVEDQDQLRSFAQLALERQGYTVLTAASGDEALHLAETHRGPIHLVITDVVMPRMSGRALAERLTAQRPGLRVLYMSGYTDDAILRHGILEAGLPFLQKPFTQTQLVRKVRDVLDAAQG